METEQIVNKVASMFRSFDWMHPALRVSIACRLEDDWLKKDYADLILFFQQFGPVFKKEKLFDEIVMQIEQEKLVGEVGVEILNSIIGEE